MDSWKYRAKFYFIKSIIRNIHKKKIAQIDLKTGNIIRKFESIRDVNREFGYDTSAISRVCLGKQKTSYGYGWKYIDD